MKQLVKAEMSKIAGPPLLLFKPATAAGRGGRPSSSFYPIRPQASRASMRQMVEALCCRPRCSVFIVSDSDLDLNKPPVDDTQDRLFPSPFNRASKMAKGLTHPRRNFFPSPPGAFNERPKKILQRPREVWALIPGGTV